MNIYLYNYVTLDFMKKILYVRTTEIEIKGFYIAFVHPCNRHRRVIEFWFQSRPTIAWIVNASPLAYPITNGDVRENKTNSEMCNEGLSSPRCQHLIGKQVVHLRTYIYKNEWRNLDLLHSRFLSVKTGWNVQINFVFVFSNNVDSCSL
jgi:hypothetical protein